MAFFFPLGVNVSEGTTEIADRVGVDPKKAAELDRTYRQFLQPYPCGPLYTWFSGEGWMVDDTNGIQKRMQSHPNYDPHRDMPPDVWLEVIAAGFQVKPGKLSTIGLFDLYTHYRRFILYCCQEYETHGWGQPKVPATV